MREIRARQLAALPISTYNHIIACVSRGNAVEMILAARQAKAKAKADPFEDDKQESKNQGQGKKQIGRAFYRPLPSAPAEEARDISFP